MKPSRIALGMIIAGTLVAAACAVRQTRPTQAIYVQQGGDKDPPPIAIGGGSTPVYTSPAADGPVSVQTVTDNYGNQLQIEQGAPGNPAVVGCADGQREGFISLGRFPRIAGCLASWSGPASLRLAQTGAACGDDTNACAVPADACAQGWHVCGVSGRVAELRAIDATDCANAGGGRYSGAISHCLTQDGCEYDHSPNAVYQCFDSGWCSEPVCCGSGCSETGACTDGVWQGGQTHIPVGTDQGCGAMRSDRAGGVMCCQ